MHEHDQNSSARDSQSVRGNDGISRRSFLQAGAVAGSLALGTWPAASAQETDSLGAQNGARFGGDHDVAGASIAELQQKLSSGRLSSRELVDIYLQRIRVIDKGLDLRAVLQINPDAQRIAEQLDQERHRKGSRGPLHGIPILLKDNIDTADATQTTAGSLALAGAPAPMDATVTRRLRDAGAVILGKANLSEWANFRGFASSSGWSGVKGQCRNPHVLDRNPCGSSSGSGAAVAAALTAVALGTETDGSIVCPAGQCGVAGIKPTVGLTSRAGVVPISFTQDTVGVHGRSLADAATVLGALTGADPRDAKTAGSIGHFSRDYRQFIDSKGLAGARIGVARQFTGTTSETDEVFEQALQAMRDAGAILIDPVEIPSFDAFNADPSETIVLVFEFKRDLNAYLATRTGVPANTLEQVIQFNLDHADEELRFFGQELMEMAQADTFSEAEYQQALVRGRMLAADQGIDAALAANNLDALVAPTNTPAWPNDLINGDAFLFGSSGFAAVAGYPLVTVTGGYAFDLPVGITFMASAWSEPKLIRIASGFEAAADVRRRPRFLRTFKQDNSDRPRMHDADNFATSNARAPAQKYASRFDAFMVPRLRRPLHL
ncbi:MAG TPA: amidase [Steroidobacteraceae bacterium]|jgi:amidase